MPPDETTEYYSFYEVFTKEAKVINARRFAVAEGRLATDRGATLEGLPPLTDDRRREIKVQIMERTAKIPDETDAGRDERCRRVPRPSQGHNLTGLALSGGGIRSASFCLGVLQAIDALRENHEPQVLDQIDYLSTVSGGGYTGTSLVSGLMQAQGRFPFASKLDQEETIEVQHIRDYSNFLAPQGLRDYLLGFIAVSRGLLVNAMVFLGVLLLLAAFTIYLNPDIEELNQGAGGLELFGLTLITFGLFLLAQMIFALYSSHRKANRQTLTFREKWAKWLARAFMVALVIAFAEAQAFVIARLVDKDLTHWLGELLPKVWAALLPVAIALGASAGKLTTIVRTTLGDKSWKGSFKRWTSQAALYLAAAVVPFLLWCVYILLCYWGVRANMTGPRPYHPGVPDWLTQLSGWFPVKHSFARLYSAVGLVLLFLSLFVKPNAGSLNGYYRDRLSRAFLWRLDKLRKQAQERWDADAPDPLDDHDCAAVGKHVEKAQGKEGAGKAAITENRKKEKPEIDVDRFTFSSLKKRKKWRRNKKLKVDGIHWEEDVRFSPYLLVNTAVNLEGSDYLNRRGRNADSFVLSPLYIGSEATGYAKTLTMERIDRGINLGTAMAASGAAASANMGAQTIKPLTFSLAALNVRLGYWIPNPRYAKTWTGWNSYLASVGPIYYAMETFGAMNEERLNVYLTDGGHFDNLGIYELLKRRCSLIIAVDAEADPGMHFESFVRVQRYARIDLGTRIDLPWEAVHRSALAISKEGWRKPLLPDGHQGPHVAVGRIDYGYGERGVLIYVKSSMSGDESDLICDYKRRNEAFPHETTADQFFSEEQFEVYRALGFHATKGFLEGNDAFGMFPAGRHEGWLELLDHALKHLNLPEKSRRKILARASNGSVGAGKEQSTSRSDKAPIVIGVAQPEAS
ncbi:patatin-like phospholipase family protein [Microvirga sp. M2]|uniref:patatin-like phospholipase family protein n=1 Tax=Microvirga sp. M2 TaxID=3073270 RepID=UPI0039C28FE5